MKRRDNARRGTAGGFTLVELLVVMGIIGLLVGLLIPAVNYAITAGRVAATHNVISGLSTGLYTFKADWNVFPPSRRGTFGVSSMVTYNKQYGFQLLPLYLIGPQGNGWGAGNNKLSPFGSPAVGQFGPYFQPERGADITVVRDAFPLTQRSVSTSTDSCAGCILYYRFDPNGTPPSVTGFTGLSGLLDCQDNLTTLSVESPTEGFKDAAHFVRAVAVPAPQGGGTRPARWRSEDFVLISAGPDRLFGHVRIRADGIPEAIKQGDDPGDFTYDDVTSFSR